MKGCLVMKTWMTPEVNELNINETACNWGHNNGWNGKKDWNCGHNDKPNKKDDFFGCPEEMYS